MKFAKKIKFYLTSKFNIYLIIMLLLIGTCIFFILGQTKTQDSILLGYCPTMKYVAEKIVLQNENIKLISYESSSEVLNNLKQGKLDVALIGRLAQNSELTFANEKRLTKGYTLIVKEKNIIQKDLLKDAIIHTYISKDIANDLLPESNIVFNENKTDALMQIENYPVLINWDDYDNQELLVVMKKYEKDISFRIPTLYSLKFDLEKIEVTI